jgi:acyl-CoA thioester hydrolase
MFEVKIYYEDTDSIGIVYYVNYLKYMERARSEYLGLSEMRRLNEAGFSFVVYEVNVRYVAPARLGDTLTVTARPLLESDYRIKFRQEINHKESGKLLVKGEVEVVFVDRSGLIPIPAEMKAKLLAEKK